MSTEPTPTTGTPGDGPDGDRTEVLGVTAPDSARSGDTLTDLPVHGAPGATTTTATTAEPAPADEPEQPDRTDRTERGPRVGTVVWGLVLAVLGVGVLAWADGRHIDVDVAAIVLVAGAGVALLVGSIVSGARRRR